jgi:hypothetical protein
VISTCLGSIFCYLLSIAVGRLLFPDVGTKESVMGCKGDCVLILEMSYRSHVCLIFTGLAESIGNITLRSY